MTTNFCPYCTQPFEGQAQRYSWQPAGRATCGRRVCRSRTQSWNGWISREQHRAVGGDVNRPAPKPRPLAPFSAKTAEGLDELVESFQSTFELEGAA